MIDDFKTPGQYIQALLEERGWTNRVLALVANWDESTVHRIVSDKRAMDGELALILEEIFDVPAERFLELQQSYELARARIKARPNPQRSTRAHLFGGLPVSEMIRRGWISAEDIKDAAVEPELMRFFGVNRLEDIEILPHAAKKTQVSLEATPAQLAWLYRVKKIASEMLVGRYSQESAEMAARKMKSLLSAPEEARKVPRILAEAGIRFVIVESLPAAKIDGACLWLSENAPVIGMTMRYDRIDNFWFVLRHELEHVIRSHGRTRATAMLDVEIEGTTGIDEEEQIANAAAGEFCVPAKMMQAFIARKAPFFHERDILGFAKTIGVHPGLVAGQLRRHLGRYDLFGSHMAKMRSIVIPNAFTDGWGNVAPVEQ